MEPKYPLEYYLQEKVKDSLKKSTYSNKIDWLKIVVKKNLEIQKELFDKQHPIDKNYLPNELTRKNAIENLKKKYSSTIYIQYFQEPTVSTDTEERCLIKDDKTINRFLDKDYTKGKKYHQVKVVLDFFSVYLGFEGWKDGSHFEFEIEKKKGGQESIPLFTQSPEIIALQIKEKGLSISRQVNDILSDLLQEEDLTNWANDPDQVLSELFDDVLLSKKLSKQHSLLNRIDNFFNNNPAIEYQWPFRAILASALTLSVIKFWDWKKIDLLTRLALRREDPIVSERAIIGLSLALLLSYRNKKDFSHTLEIMKNNFGKDIYYCAGVFECIYFFLKKMDAGNFDNHKEADLLLENAPFNNQYQYFEPAHTDISFYEIDYEKIPFENENDVESFFKRLNASISINYSDKIKVLYKFNDLNIEKTDELLKIFSDEEKDWNKLEKSNLEGMYSSKFTNYLEEFMFQLRRFDISQQYLSLIKKRKKRITSRFLAKKLIHIFPYAKYIEILEDHSIVSQNVDMSNQSTLFYLADYYKSLAENGNKAIENYKSAIASYETVLKKEPKNTHAIQQIATSHYKIAQLEQDSIESYKNSLIKGQEIIAIDPKNKVATALIIESTKKILEKGEATINNHKIIIDRLEYLFQKNPENVDFLPSLALSYFSVADFGENPIHNYELAIKYYEHYLNFDLKNKIVIQQIGMCFERIATITGQTRPYWLAIEKFEKFLGKKSNFDILVEQIGACYFKIAELKENPLINYKRSIDFYKQFRISNPDNTLAITHMATAYSKIAALGKDSISNYKLSKKMFELLLEMKHDDDLIIQQIAWCYLMIGELGENPEENYTTAITKFEQTLHYSKDSNRFWSIRQIGWCYLMLKKPRESKHWFLKAINAKGKEFAYKNLGHCELILKNQKVALEYYQLSLKLWRNRSDFFADFEDDFKYIEPQNISQKYYQEIRFQLENESF